MQILLDQAPTNKWTECWDCWGIRQLSQYWVHSKQLLQVIIDIPVRDNIKLFIHTVISDGVELIDTLAGWSKIKKFFLEARKLIGALRWNLSEE